MNANNYVPSNRQRQLLSGWGTMNVLGHDLRLCEMAARILEGIATGESTVRMATRLFLSQQGVEYRVGAMLRKFGVPDRAALVSKAFMLGLFGAAAWPPRIRATFVR